MITSPIIALLTDFGLSDTYVGTMKGVMLALCPAARLVDLTHDVQPQNVRQAAYLLATAYRYFPAGAVFLVVVDPGVGTARAPIAVETGHGRYVAPDNGVLSYVLAEAGGGRAYALENPAYRLAETSQTFHGRDIFAPAAAHLAAGAPASAFGPALNTLVALPTPRLAILPGRAEGEVLHSDHFGNVITSIGRLTWDGLEALRFAPRFAAHAGAPETLRAAQCQVLIGGRAIGPVRPTYGAVPPGALIALVGSAGQLEIGINQGHAASALGAAMGDPVTLVWD
jgi:S-adenosylmethionine hydrolase